MIKLLVLAGPTACGKTEYAVRLARELDGEIVSADSMQIYRYLDIGSAKPTPKERGAARHWLVDEIDPRTPFNVADYRQLAKRCIADIAGRGKLPLLCGGSGLYINSVVYRMDFSAPKGDEGFRQRVWLECGEDAARLHERLKALDAEAALAIHPNNVKRMLRAVERLENGEEKLAAFADLTEEDPEYDVLMIGLDRERSELYERIERRVDSIIAGGLEREVRGLMDMGFTSADIAMKGIGYKETMDCMAAGRPAEEAAPLIKKNTRRYARRQLIWLRRYGQMRWVSLSGDAPDEKAFSQMKALASEWMKK